MNSHKESKKINFVEIGWLALHKSVVGYNLSYPLINQDEYTKLLLPIIELTGFQFDSKFESESTVSGKIWKRIQKIEKQNRECKASRRVPLQTFTVSYDEWRKLRLGRKTERINFSDPLYTATIGWDLVKRASSPNGNMDQFLWGLGLIGWVAVVYIQLRVCKFCFRWAVPDSLFCFQHSQSTSLGISRSEAYSQYRKGREVYELIKKDGRYSPTTDSEEFAFIQSRLVLADYLFFNHPSAEECSELRELLQSAPSVLQRLGGEEHIAKMNDLDLFTHIRTTINPLFLSIELWGMMLVMAAIYFSYEDQIPERARGRPQKVVLRKQIIDLAKSGLKPSEVASKLEMSKSSLSNWIKRCVDVRKSFQ